MEKFKDYTISTYVALDVEGDDIESNLVSHTIQDSGDAFFMGMDSSAVPALEAAGVVYRNENGEVEDVFQAHAHGPLHSHHQGVGHLFNGDEQHVRLRSGGFRG